jgi:hypothetical protein
LKESRRSVSVEVMKRKMPASLRVLLEKIGVRSELGEAEALRIAYEELHTSRYPR